MTVYYLIIDVYQFTYFLLDTLKLVNRDEVEIDEDRTDISWESDRDTRFQNADGNTTFPVDGTTQPKNWQLDISELNDSLQNEDFIVWFRVSAFPNFIKLHSRLTVSGRDTLPAGNYTLQVEYSILYAMQCLHVLYSSLTTCQITL